MNIQVLFDRRKQGANGSFELYLYVTRKDFAYISTKVRIDRSMYDKKTNRVSNRHPSANTLNHQINQMLRQLEDVNLDLLRNGKTITTEIILAALNKPKITTLNDYMHQQIEIDKPLLSTGRIKHVESVLRDFDVFGTFGLDDFTADVLRKYHNHLLTHMQITTCSKNHGVIKKYISRAHNDGLIKKNVYVNFKIPANNQKRIFLEEDELKKLREYKGHPRIERVRDLFLFMCLTGLAYGDLSSLSSKHIIESNGKLFIEKARIKTDVKQTIPLFPEALELIKKYSDGEKLFPAISGQKLNAYLKELAALCDIRKEISSHTGRHTFATLLLTRGMPLESVSNMLGHSSLKTTLIYTEISSRKLQNDFDRLGIDGL